jgi:cyclophilin family peptidyl-prolyl cis-trans isomerase
MSKVKISLFLGIAALLIIILIGGFALMNEKDLPIVVLETNHGNIEIELFSDKAPNTVDNFLKLSREGFYDGTRFHRVIAGFMNQGGCPNTKDLALKDFWGTGDPGYKFNCEIHKENFNVKGTISMANAGPNTNGSQFFINVANNDWLNRGHTVFGRVISGMDVVEKINTTRTGPRDIPIEEVVIKRAVVQ